MFVPERDQVSLQNKENTCLWRPEGGRHGMGIIKAGLREKMGLHQMGSLVRTEGKKAGEKRASQAPLTHPSVFRPTPKPGTPTTARGAASSEVSPTTHAPGHSPGGGCHLHLPPPSFLLRSGGDLIKLRLGGTHGHQQPQRHRSCREVPPVLPGLVCQPHLCRRLPSSHEGPDR